MAFVNLDLTSDDAIISFCNKYGLITAEHTAEQVTNDDLYLESVKNDPLTKLQRASHEEGIGGLVMPMCDFKSAAVALRKLIELKRAISHNDIVKVLLTITYFLFDEQLKMKDKFITAVDGSKITTPDIIHVKPVLKIINGDFTSTWSVMSLLEAMYLELFLNYTVPSKEIKQCANDNCYNYFVADNPRKIYCNSRCAWAVNKRIRRKGSGQ